ncbi:MAG: preprotein translocase subunit SecG [Planctomycetaceae bacterium]|jgi:preprotein translocase subunit SecG|nr:preprotein translocase subunit SecG [Planctomycetaceae bacterium]
MFLSFLSACAMIGLCTFLILLILIQRGKGGGLAGAFGGMGGQSAFGTKAGDTFMRITIVCSIIWFVFCLAAAFWVAPRKNVKSGLGLGSGVSTSIPDNSGTGTVPGHSAVPVTIPEPTDTTAPVIPTPVVPASPAQPQE